MCASRLRGIIEARGQTLRGFSDETGIKYRSLQEYVAGNSTPGYEQLQKMSEVGVDIMYLLHGVHSSAMMQNLSPKAAKSGLLASDIEVTDHIINRLMNIIDHANQDYLKSHNSPMSLKQMMYIYKYGMSCIYDIIPKMEENLIGLRQSGVSAKAVTDIVIDVAESHIQSKINEGKL